MPRFDRYLLQQLLMLFGFFALVLVLVYWINRAVKLFDQLLANGESAGTFLLFTALSLPSVISIVLPIGAIAAAIYAANRLSGESELVVVQATGYSPYRLARPVVVFGLIVAALISVLTHVLVPASQRELALRQAEMNQNITARLLTEGAFLHPAEGITFYIREITPRGELLDVFLSDARSGKQRTNYSATKALLIRGDDTSDGGAKLVMFDGMAQTLNLQSGRLATTSFSDFAYDIGSLIGVADPTRPRAATLSTAALLAPTEALAEATGESRARLLQEGHERISQAFLAISAVVLGFATLLLGGFSRFGLWRQIVGAVVLIIILKSFDNTMLNLARRDMGYWPACYVASLVGALAALLVLWVASKPRLLSARRARQSRRADAGASP